MHYIYNDNQITSAVLDFNARYDIVNKNMCKCTRIRDDACGWFYDLILWVIYFCVSLQKTIAKWNKKKKRNKTQSH